MKYKIMNLIKTSVVSGFFFLLSGCASFSSSYPDKMKDVKKALANGGAKASKSAFITEFGKKDKSNSLYLLEQARIAQLNGQTEQSKIAYQKVIQTVADSKLAAKVQVSKLFQNASATLTNDRALTFLAPDYAMTYVYPYQALNYLVQNNLSGALVAIRQLSNAQYWTYQQKLIAGKLKQKYTNHENHIGLDQSNLDFMKSEQIQQMFSSVRQAQNSYENGFAYYLASILYSAFDSNYNNAYISIKDSQRVLPNNPYVARTYKEMRRGFNGGSAYQKGKGRMVVIYEQGFVTPKSAFQLSLFLGNLGLQQIAVPYYSSNYPLLPSAQFEVRKGGQVFDQGQTALLVNTTQMAAKSLTEEFPTIISREVIRIGLKAAATYEATRQAGDVGLILGSLYSYLTSQADQRSWLLLPNNIQLYENQFSAGKYNLAIGATRQDFIIKSGRTTLVWIVNVGDFHKVYHFVL